eukprot:COSAG06_NODE_5174_length_3662_cov_2.173730_3_plen_273_part_00
MILLFHSTTVKSWIQSFFRRQHAVLLLVLRPSYLSIREPPLHRSAHKQRRNLPRACQTTLLLRHVASSAPAPCGTKRVFFSPFIFKKAHFYQDRLGTNIGKTQKKSLFQPPFPMFVPSLSWQMPGGDSAIATSGAKRREVCSAPSATSIDAPASSNARAACRWPCAAAQCSAVAPLRFCWSIASASVCSSSCSSGRSPRSAAMCSTVSPAEKTPAFSQVRSVYPSPEPVLAKDRFRQAKENAIFDHQKMAAFRTTAADGEVEVVAQVFERPL